MRKLYLSITTCLLFGLGTTNAQLADSICNGDFEDSLNTWVSFANGGGAATFTLENTTVHSGVFGAKADVTNATGNVILRSCKGDIEANKKYRVSFWARTETGSLDIRATSSKNTSPFTNYGQLDVTLGTTWTKYSFISQHTDSVIDDVLLAKFKFLSIGVYFIDSVSVEKFDAISDICNGDFEAGLANWNTTVSGIAVATITAQGTEVHGGAQAAEVAVTTPDAPSNVQLTSCSSDMEDGKTYSVTFWAKTDGGFVNMKTKTALGSAPFTDFDVTDHLINSSWKQYVHSFTADTTIVGNVKLAKFQFGDTGTIYIDDVQIVEGLVSGIKDQEDPSVSVYPNPASSVIAITAEGPFEAKIFSLYGIEAKQATANTRSEIDLTGLKPGVYLVRVTTLIGVTTRRLVIE